MKKVIAAIVIIFVILLTLAIIIIVLKILKNKKQTNISLSVDTFEQMTCQCGDFKTSNEELLLLIEDFNKNKEDQNDNK